MLISFMIPVTIEELKVSVYDGTILLLVVNIILVTSINMDLLPLFGELMDYSMVQQAYPVLFVQHMKIYVFQLLK